MLLQLRIENLETKMVELIYEKREKYLGYPITILSSFLSSTIMFEIKKYQKPV